MESIRQEPSKDLRHTEYIRLLMANHNLILTYILMLVPSVPDAEDILQETAAVLWEKFDQYEPGTDFASWAVTIARYKIMHLQREKSNSRIKFSSSTLDTISEYLSSKEQNDLSHELLHKCLNRLNDKDRKLIMMRYQLNISVKELAKRIDRPVQGLYSTLTRIHTFLIACVQRTQQEELS
ncbi:sigma-70 family RNA polymerase sigma factor [Anaerohalosphaeraceae bacterium U12dextr]